MTQAVEYDPFAGVTLEQVLQATPSQQEIWMIARHGSDASCSFNESISLRLHGKLDQTALTESLLRLFVRHESLRGAFSPYDGRLCVASQPNLLLSPEDLRDLTPAHRQERLRAVLAAEVETPFELEHGPLLRVRLLRLGDEEFWLTFTAHHIICDGWSMSVLLRDLVHLYNAARAHSPITLPPAQPFSAYTSWTAALPQAEAHQKARHYWLDQLQGELPVLQLPTDRPHQPLRTFRSDRHDHVLAPSLVQALKKLGASGNASFFTTLLAGFAAFLHRLTGQNDLLIVVPSAGQAISGLGSVVGHCVNLLPIRCTLDPTVSFQQFLQQMRRQVLDAYDHQLVTYAEILPQLKFRRDPSRPLLVSVAFNVDQALQPKDLPFADLEVEYQSNPRHFESFEWFINASEAAGQVVLECQYNVDLFDAETIADRLESFEALLADAVHQPQGMLQSLALLSQAQQRRTFVEWNATALDYPRDMTVARLLHEQAMRTPNRPALTFAGTTLTYAELDRRANQLANHLAAQGVGSGVLVGLCLERSLDLVVGMLAILKAGAGYLPLDPQYPRERLAFMLTDSGSTVVVTEEPWLALLPHDQLRVICLGRDAPAIRGQPDTPPSSLAQADGVAYLIYTSGSTGIPKGVAVLNTGVVNLFASMRRWPGLNECDVLLALTTVSFDMSVTEILLPLSVGAQVVLAPPDVPRDGHLLLNMLRTSGASVAQGTPATWRLLLQAGWQGEPSFTIWTGGEALAPDLARALLERAPTALWNLYGPTETTVYSTGTQVHDADHVRIGRPLANTLAYILDGNGQPVPVGVPGELYLGGAGVAAGYLHRPEMTAQRFVENPYHDPFADYANPRLYRTGDLVCWHRDGTIEYLGRNDNQIKLRGMRIEPGEIEAALTTHPAVRQAVVMVRSEQGQDGRMAAYFTAATGRTATVTELRKHLRQRLPEYMVPQHFVELDELPLTANGKVDRSRLPSPARRSSRSEAPRPQVLTPAQNYVLRLCREVLEHSNIGAEDNFFQVGGHSLLAMRLLARFEEDTGTRLSPRVLILDALGRVADSLPADRIPKE